MIFTRRVLLVHLYSWHRTLARWWKTHGVTQRYLVFCVTVTVVLQIHAALRG